jgi:hypothetical protein
VNVGFEISWDPGCSDDEIELKIKRDLPGSWSLIGILWVITLHLGITCPPSWIPNIPNPILL